jgi:hypothetical protein
MMRFAAVAMLSLLLVACSNTSGQPLLAAGERVEARFFVERHPKDGRDLARSIAEALTERGYQATSGTGAERPPDADYLVTYVDRWQWDMRMYLVDLRIDVRQPDSNAIVAYGQSFQDSMAAMGKSHRDVIDRALDEIFSAQR